VFIRRHGGRGAGPITFARVGFFFLAAGIWIAGVRVGNDTVTSIAIVVAAIAIFMGWIGRRHPVETEAGEGEGEGEGEAVNRPPPGEDPTADRN